MGTTLKLDFVPGNPSLRELFLHWDLINYISAGLTRAQTLLIGFFRCVLEPHIQPICTSIIRMFCLAAAQDLALHRTQA